MSRVAEEFTVFNNVAKLMNKKDISTNLDTLTRYREAIVPAYNKFVKYINENYKFVKQNDQYKLDDWLEKARLVFVKCLDNLKCGYSLPVDLKEIVREVDVSSVPTNVSVDASTSSNDNVSNNEVKDDDNSGNDISSANNVDCNNDNGKNDDPIVEVNIQNNSNSVNDENSDRENSDSVSEKIVTIVLVRTTTWL